MKIIVHPRRIPLPRARASFPSTTCPHAIRRLPTDTQHVVWVAATTYKCFDQSARIGDFCNHTTVVGVDARMRRHRVSSWLFVPRVMCVRRFLLRTCFGPDRVSLKTKSWLHTSVTTDAAGDAALRPILWFFGAETVCDPALADVRYNAELKRKTNLKTKEQAQQQAQQQECAASNA